VIATGQAFHKTGFDLLTAPTDGAEGLGADNVIAVADTKLALNTTVEIGDDNGVQGYIPVMTALFLFMELALPGAMGIRHILQSTLTALIADRAVQRVVDQQKFQRRFARLQRIRGLGVNHHTLSDWRGAGGEQLALPFHFYQADPAGRQRFQPWV
jgi:hypothetical protein